MAIASEFFLYLPPHYLCKMLRFNLKMINKCNRIKRLQVTTLAEVQVSESANASLQADPSRFFFCLISFSHKT